MISKGVILFCVWVFFTLSVGHFAIGEGNNDQNLTVKISFLCNDPTESLSFFLNDLHPVYEELSKCVSWSFYPLYIREQPLPRPSYNVKLDSIYQCAYHLFKFTGSKLGIFYICMMDNGENPDQARSCAMKSGIDWIPLSKCKYDWPTRSYDIINVELTVELNGVKSAAATRRNFKGAVCDKLNEMKKPCACCPAT